MPRRILKAIEHHTPSAYLALLVLSVAALSILLVWNLRLSNEGRHAHAAICALESDLQQRVDNGRQFLKDHPKGLPGIATAAQIRSTIRNEERTVKKLAIAKC